MYTYFLQGSDDAPNTSDTIPPKSPPAYHKRMVTKHTMKDFIGLENANDEAKKAMMDFSYLSAIGNMDEAFKAIKLIKR
jgi:intraflagellar transport protein 140